MSCIEINISRLGNGIDIHTKKASEDMSLNVSLRGALSKIKAFLSSEGIKVRCSIVCSVTEIFDYLNVTPNEVQWITDDVGVFFDVESNVQWIVTTD